MDIIPQWTSSPQSIPQSYGGGCSAHQCRQLQLKTDILWPFTRVESVLQPEYGAILRPTPGNLDSQGELLGTVQKPVNEWCSRINTLRIELEQQGRSANEDV